MEENAPSVSNAAARATEGETVIVALRVKPLLAHVDPDDACVNVTGRSSVEVVKCGSKTSALASQREKRTPFAFDLAFGGAARTEEVFRGVVVRHSLIERLMKGVNCTIFAYGATGAGKTYTMLGSGGVGGVIQMTAERLFERVHALNSVEGGAVEIGVCATYAEIYNESIHDLLSDGERVKLKPCEDKEGNVKILGLQSEPVDGIDDLMQLVEIGTQRRRMSPTAANEVSSRSHAVLNVTLRWRRRGGGGTRRGRKTAMKNAVRLEASLCLIDLAGSERAARTCNHGKQLREGANINKSLLALAGCIRALAVQRKGGSSSAAKVAAGRVKYRDSKLTLLLKPSLQGKSILVMIACVDPKPVCYEDSKNTLKYANRTKMIKCKARSSASDAAAGRNLATLWKGTVRTMTERIKAGAPPLPPRAAQRARDANRSAAAAENRARNLARGKKRAAAANGRLKRSRAQRKQAGDDLAAARRKQRKKQQQAKHADATMAIREARRKAKSSRATPQPAIVILTPSSRPPPPPQDAAGLAGTVKLPQRHSSVGLPAMRRIVQLRLDAAQRDESPPPTPPADLVSPARAADLAATLPGRRASAAFEELMRQSSGRSASEIVESLTVEVAPSATTRSNNAPSPNGAARGTTFSPKVRWVHTARALVCARARARTLRAYAPLTHPPPLLLLRIFSRADRGGRSARRAAPQLDRIVLLSGRVGVVRRGEAAATPRAAASYRTDAASRWSRDRAPPRELQRAAGPGG
jgi:hypothetical protein